jgi:diguanylate cyclase (GGDEF)-like protein
MRTIEQVALIDPLTKISNRRGFNKLLDNEWRKAVKNKKPISFMLIDADKFKVYNDTYGHPQGDKLLQTIANVFKQLAPFHECAARWGGEEFVILMPGTNIEQAAETAEKVRSEVEASVILTEDSAETRITVSIGLNSVIPDEESVIGDFINKADQALYKAKEAGRNRVMKSEN